jgi:hypothetical protein
MVMSALLAKSSMLPDAVGLLDKAFSILSADSPGGEPRSHDQELAVVEVQTRRAAVGALLGESIELPTTLTPGVAEFEDVINIIRRASIPARFSTSEANALHELLESWPVYWGRKPKLFRNLGELNMLPVSLPAGSG